MASSNTTNGDGGSITNPHARFAQYPSLKNKVVLVTGGAEGIGASCVSQFAHQSSQVLCLDISEPSARKLIAKLKQEGASPPPEFYHCDVTDLKSLKETCDTILSKYTTVDILVNNAASAGAAARAGTFDVTEETFQFSIDVNLRHLFFLTQHLAPAMRAAGSGSIVNMGSISWRIPAVGMPIYVACKAAIVGLTKTHAREFGGDGVRVNSVMPGSIATERQLREVLNEKRYLRETIDAQAIKRALEPDEVGRLILFLGSEDSSAITGSNYVVDGGWVGDM